MQTAYEADNHIINADGTTDYDTDTMIDAEVPAETPEIYNSSSSEPDEEQFSIDDLAE